MKEKRYPKLSPFKARHEHEKTEEVQIVDGQRAVLKVNFSDGQEEARFCQKYQSRNMLQAVRHSAMAGGEFMKSIERYQYVRSEWTDLIIEATMNSPVARFELFIGIDKFKSLLSPKDLEVCLCISLRECYESRFYFLRNAEKFKDVLDPCAYEEAVYLSVSDKENALYFLEKRDDFRDLSSFDRIICNASIHLAEKHEEKS